MTNRCPACGFPLSDTGAPLTPGRRRTAILFGHRVMLSSEGLAVVDRLCAGRHTDEIAADLRLPLATVSATIRQLRAATGSRTTAQMIARLVRCGLGEVNVTRAQEPGGGPPTPRPEAQP